MRQVTLPSGAVLGVEPAPFAAAKALHQAILAEFRGVQVSANLDMVALFKDLFCTGFSSKLIESCLNECFKRCTYNAGEGKGALKLEESAFEPVNRRQDYMVVCKEVAQDNVSPFLKSLSADYKQFLSMTGNIPESPLPMM